MIRANLPTFFVILVLIIGAVWWLMDWRYGGVITNRDSEISLLKGQRDDYKDKLGGASPDQAKARIDALEARLDARLSAIEPRRLVQARRSSLASDLRGPVYSISISSEMTGDSAQYGTDLTAAFQEAGNWKINSFSIMGPGFRPPSGISIVFPNALEPPAAALLVMSALRKSGISFDIQNRPMNLGADVEMVITTKFSP